MKKITFLLLITALFGWAKTMHQGKILETMNSGGYTYMKVIENGKSYWIAATQMAVKKGDDVAFAEEMMMQQFQSKTLNRTFDNIMFVSEVQGEDADKNSHEKQNIHVKNPLESTLKKAEVSPYKTTDTLGVAEVFGQAKSLEGKNVKVRGKVAKVSHMIMGKNWIHIQDGTGDDKTDDLVFTSEKNDAKVGDVVTAEGVVVVDKDFGYGYFYPVIIENSSFGK